jgi:hypothetical protein
MLFSISGISMEAGFVSIETSSVSFCRKDSLGVSGAHHGGWPSREG